MPACLIALTPAARRALGGDRCEVARYPFRVGRECRRPGGRGTRDRPERRSPEAQGINDVYLDDAGRNGIDVSREHFQIELGPEGHALVDRSSACGTIVEGRLVGGDRTGGAQPCGTTTSSWSAARSRRSSSSSALARRSR